MSFLLQVFFAIFSATVFALALPNEFLTFGSPVLGLFALVPFYIAISTAKTFKRAMLITMIQTILVHLLSSFWLGFFKSAGFATLGSSSIGNSLLSAFFGALMFMPWATENGGTKLCVRASIETWRIPLRVIWFPLAYIIWEWVKSTGYLGYPWGTLSTTAFGWRTIMQVADITGTYGVTFLFAFFASVIAEGIMLLPQLASSPEPRGAAASYRNVAAVWAVLFTCASFYGAYKCAAPRVAEKTMNIVMVQQNYDPWTTTDDTATVMASQKMSREKIEEFKSRGEKADLVVWSEGVLYYSFPDSEYHYEINPKESPLIPFIREMDTPFIIGGSYVLDWDTNKFVNSAFMFEKDGKISEKRYGKLHLVPFAEAVPIADVSDKFRKFLIDIFGFAGWIPGNEYVIFDTDTNSGDVNFSVPICYDDAFPEVMRPLWQNGSEVFINISDDSWSRMKSSEIQHAVVASYRAIECRTTLVRSTNAGYSVIFDPTAKIIFEMPLFETTAAAVSVPIYKRVCTPYLMLGNWLPALCVICGIILALWTRVFFSKNS